MHKILHSEQNKNSYFQIECLIPPLTPSLSFFLSLSFLSSYTVKLSDKKQPYNLIVSSGCYMPGNVIDVNKYTNKRFPGSKVPN